MMQFFADFNQMPEDEPDASKERYDENGDDQINQREANYEVRCCKIGKQRHKWI